MSDILPARNRSMTHRQSHRPENFNHYYIDPVLRYRQVSHDPRRNKDLLKDEEYLYKNLHNKQFWNWVHPLARQGRSDMALTAPKLTNKKQTEKLVKIQVPDPSVNPEAHLKKVHLPILAAFKDHLQQNLGQRVPLSVERALKSLEQAAARDKAKGTS